MENKYEILYKLKELLIETSTLENKDIYIQAAKVLSFIHKNTITSERYNEILKFYLNSVEKNTELCEEIKRSRHGRARLALLSSVTDIETKKILDNFSYEVSKSAEFINFELPIYQDFLYYWGDEYRNCNIFNGIFSHCESIIGKYANIGSCRFNKDDYALSKDSLLFLFQVLYPYYDFYYLENLATYSIRDLNNFNYNLLKIAIIRVLDKLIDYLLEFESKTKEISRQAIPDEILTLSEVYMETYSYISLHLSATVKNIAEDLCKHTTTIDDHIEIITNALNIPNGIKSLRKFIEKYNHTLKTKV